MTTPIIEPEASPRLRQGPGLAGLDLTAEPGQVVAVLGPNGAGKTTFVSTWPRSSAPTGTVLVGGHDVSAPPLPGAPLHRARRPVRGGGGGDDRAENLELVARLFGHDRRTAGRQRRAVLEQLDLGEEADRLVRTYSGGERRRFDLGRAWPVSPGCCSSTSRPPGWTLAAASSSGTRSATWPKPAPTSC